jgi:hypothetical protein
MGIHTVITPYIFIFVDRTVESYQKKGYIILVAHENKRVENFQRVLSKN